MTSMNVAVDADSTTAKRQLSVRVLHSFAEPESLRSAWNDLVLRSGADVYQTFDWCRLWWQHYGERRQLHLLLCFLGEELVGMVPAFVETLWLGPVHLRVAKLVGSDFGINLCNLPVVRDSLQRVVSRAIHHFLGEQHCDLLLFGPLSGPTGRLDELLAIGQRDRLLVQRADALGDSCNTYWDLPDTFKEYLKSLGAKERGNFNRRLTQLSKGHRVTFDVVSQVDKVASEFEGFRLLHDAQWQAEGNWGTLVTGRMPGTSIGISFAPWVGREWSASIESLLTTGLYPRNSAMFFARPTTGDFQPGYMERSGTDWV